MKLPFFTAYLCRTCCVVLLLIASVAPAQSQQYGTLSLFGPPAVNNGDDLLAVVIDRIWSDSPPVLEALEEIDAAGFDVIAARMGYLPRLQFQASEDNRNRRTSSVTVIQPVWDGGATGANVRTAKLGEKLAVTDLDAVRLSIGQEAAASYFDLARANELALSWRQYIAELESLIHLVERRVAEGASPAADIELANVRLKQAKASEVANRGRGMEARSELEVYLPGVDIEPQWPPVYVVMPASEIYAKLGVGAPFNHPLRQQAVLNMKTQHERGQLAKAGLWPKLSLQHVRQFEQLSGDFEPEESTQLVVQMNTDDGLRGETARRAQYRRVRAAKQAIRHAERRIVSNIRSALSKRNAALNEFESQASAAVSTRNLVDSYLRQFKAGRKSWLEVLNVRREAQDARILAATAKRNYWVADTQLSLESMLWHRRNKEAVQ